MTGVVTTMGSVVPAGDIGGTNSRLGLFSLERDRSRLCEKALELFISVYGAAAGNLALHSMAVSGVYIGGGIAPKILWELKSELFMNAFKNKGRLSGILAQVPVKVIMNENVGLLGAASCAVEGVQDS